MNDLSTVVLTLMASALGGAMVTVGFGVYNLRKSKEDERAKWIRDSKLEAYSAYLDVTQSMALAVSAHRAAIIDQLALVTKFGEYAPGKVEILAPPDLLEAADSMDEWLNELMNESRNPRVPSLESEESFSDDLEELSARRRKVIALMQQDLDLDPIEYPVSGSELRTSSIATGPKETAATARRT